MSDRLRERERDFVEQTLGLVNRYRMLCDWQDTTTTRRLLDELVSFAAGVNAAIAALLEDVCVRLDASPPKTASSPPPRAPSQ